MLSDASFVLQSLNSNLYFLRTLREFCTNLQLSFLSNNEEYIDTARDFGKRCEELGAELIKYANGNVTKQALDNQIFVTDYTLDMELLTEKLFPIDIDTEITKRESALTPGFDENPSMEVVRALEKINNDALILVTNFIDFCQSIKIQMEDNRVFAYFYISLIDAILVEMNLYMVNLERLISKSSISPTFIAGYEYLFNDLLQRYSSFIRGLVDPSNNDTIIRATVFYNQFNALANKYKSTGLTPDIQTELKKESEELVDSFRRLITQLMSDVLSSNTYFLAPPIFLDNIYTTANYFKYVLQTSDFDINKI